MGICKLDPHKESAVADIKGINKRLLRSTLGENKSRARDVRFDVEYFIPGYDAAIHSTYPGTLLNF